MLADRRWARIGRMKLRATSSLDPTAAQNRYERFRTATELPMSLLALALGLILLFPIIFKVSPGTETNLDLAGWLIWGAFLFEYLALLWLAPDKWQMVREHPIELLLILVPVLRPLRFLRVLQAVSGLGATVQSLTRMFSRPGFHWFLAFATGVIFASAAATFAFERGAADAEITSLSEALWWAIVTCTTVGYGDFTPVSAGGRGVAVLLMLLGVSLISVITANIASFMVEEDTTDENRDLRDQLEQLNAKLDRLLEVR